MLKVVPFLYNIWKMEKKSSDKWSSIRQFLTQLNNFDSESKFLILESLNSGQIKLMLLYTILNK